MEVTDARLTTKARWCFAFSVDALTRWLSGSTEDRRGGTNVVAETRPGMAPVHRWLLGVFAALLVALAGMAGGRRRQAEDLDSGVQHPGALPHLQAVGR